MSFLSFQYTEGCFQDRDAEQAAKNDKQQGATGDWEPQNQVAGVGSSLSLAYQPAMLTIIQTPDYATFVSAESK